MRRLFTFLLIITLTATISGCGNNPTIVKEQKSEETSVASSTEADLKKAGEDLAFNQ